MRNSRRSVFATPGNGVGPEVAVHLLRPVAHVRGHVRPEVRVGEPALERVLVDGDVARALPEPDHEDGAARGPPAVAVVEPAHELPDVGARVAVAPANGGRELVQHPAVAARDVVARLGHALARRDARRVPRGTRARDPAAPGREVDFGHGVEVGTECADARRLVAPEGRLVGDERRDRDVVVGARRCSGRELRRQPEPVGRGIEDRT